MSGKAGLLSLIEKAHYTINILDM